MSEVRMVGGQKCINSRCNNEATLATENGAEWGEAKLLKRDLNPGEIVNCDDPQKVMFWCERCWEDASYVTLDAARK